MTPDIPDWLLASISFCLGATTMLALVLMADKKR